MNKQEHILRKNQRVNVHPQLRAAWLLIPCVKVTLTETSTKALVRLEYLYYFGNGSVSPEAVMFVIFPGQSPVCQKDWRECKVHKQ